MYIVLAERILTVFQTSMMKGSEIYPINLVTGVQTWLLRRFLLRVIVPIIALLCALAIVFCYNGLFNGSTETINWIAASITIACLFAIKEMLSRSRIVLWSHPLNNSEGRRAEREAFLAFSRAADLLDALHMVSECNTEDERYTEIHSLNTSKKLQAACIRMLKQKARFAKRRLAENGCRFGEQKFADAVDLLIGLKVFLYADIPTDYARRAKDGVSSYLYMIANEDSQADEPDRKDVMPASDAEPSKHEVPGNIPCHV